MKSSRWSFRYALLLLWRQPPANICKSALRLARHVSLPHGLPQVCVHTNRQPERNVNQSREEIELAGPNRSFFPHGGYSRVNCRRPRHSIYSSMPTEEELG